MSNAVKQTPPEYLTKLVAVRISPSLDSAFRAAAAAAEMTPAEAARTAITKFVEAVVDEDEAGS